MSLYKIVYLRNSFYEIVKFYPEICSILYLSQNDYFETKQMELIFEPFLEYKDRLIYELKKRDDYTYVDGYHQLLNSLTGEIIKIKINQYDIEVNEFKGKHVIYDLLNTFSQNFYMIE